ncbi:hypothetical protein COP2_044866 [Malus domestica]
MMNLPNEVHYPSSKGPRLNHRVQRYRRHMLEWLMSLVFFTSSGIILAIFLHLGQKITISPKQPPHLGSGLMSSTDSLMHLGHDSYRLFMA